MNNGKKAKRLVVDQNNFGQGMSSGQLQVPMTSSNQIYNLNIQTIEQGGSVNFGNIIIEGISTVQTSVGQPDDSSQGTPTQPKEPGGNSPPVPPNTSYKALGRPWLKSAEKRRRQQ